jgi:hypothetical protein
MPSIGEYIKHTRFRTSLSGTAAAHNLFIRRHSGGSKLKAMPRTALAAQEMLLEFPPSSDKMYQSR